ncbi:MAG: bifunctional glutamate N-acetyltransferase/amino-acid acetyltransferase ArgJ [Chloroflexi bacterium]|nr:bifunctional glutamate N-acetyltransferase/amino-acid acetyltransferase ArgJ [Chloroflexota bacterium]
MALPDPSVTAPDGFLAGATSAGVKEGTSRLDLAIVAAGGPCAAHALFTQSQVVAAPVIVSRERIQSGRAQGIVVNSGNANACNGPDGLTAARAMADAAAGHIGVDPSLMLVASTGLIGAPFPIERVLDGIRKIRLTPTGGHDAAKAIMTTDLVAKEAARVGKVGERRVTVAGMAKGSGMIHPQMATMLAVITTDAALEPPTARTALKRATDASFNQVSVDRDTSTNDTVVLLAGGAAGGVPIQSGSLEARAFGRLLDGVCIDLARMIASDGEGASRLIEVSVEGARSTLDARRLAREVAASNLVKAAVYGRDPNWGRIMMAMGNAGVRFDPAQVDIYIGDHQVARQGAFFPFDWNAVAGAMGSEEVVIRIRLDAGTAAGSAWGCDLTEGYVKINAEYTT